MLPLFGLKRRAARLVGECARRGKLVCLAESCTGGFLSKLITDIPGSSEAFWGGLVVYSNESKIRYAGVRRETLDRFGAVSRETVSELLDGLFASSPADIALAISGIAGPGGGSEEKPVGTVWIGFAARGKEAELRRELFSGGREAVRRQACRASLNYIIGMLEKPSWFEP